MPVNEYGQMIGELMEGYTPGELPSIDFLEGRYARIEALSGTSGRYGGTGYRLKSDVGS